MAVPKKCTSLSKKCIRKNIWKGKGYWAALKALPLGKSLSTENSKSFLCDKQISHKLKHWNNLNRKIGLFSS